MSAADLDLGVHRALNHAAHKDRDYRRAYYTVAVWAESAPLASDVYAVTEWAVRQYRDEGWLLGCVYRDLTAPWRAVVGTDPMEVFR